MVCWGRRLADSEWMASAGAAENPAKRGHAIFMSALEHPARISPFLWFDGNAEEAVVFLSECL
jgi:hypothetical protein